MPIYPLSENHLHSYWDCVCVCVFVYVCVCVCTRVCVCVCEGVRVLRGKLLELHSNHREVVIIEMWVKSFSASHPYITWFTVVIVNILFPSHCFSNEINKHLC